MIDPETGEIINEKNWVGYDGFNEKGYRYRSRANYIRYYFDSLPGNFDEDTFLLLFMIAELMNNENILVYRIERKSKFSSIIYKPLLKEDIRERIRYKFGINKFDRCWRELCKSTLKKIQYHDVSAWAVNPSIVSKCRDVPYWLYEEFQETMNPHLSGITINKLQQKILEYSNNNEIIR